MKQRTLSLLAGSLFLVCGGSLVLTSCGGPERAPRQPIPGVDFPHDKSTNPHDVLVGPGWQVFLGTFVKEVATTVEAAPGEVVILPALTLNPDVDRFHVNGLGERLATETAVGLEDENVRSLSGSDLQLAMHKKNLSLKFYGSTADAVEIGKALGATYVITGTTRHRVFEGVKRDEQLEIDWVCRKVADGSNVVRYRPEPLTAGPLADDLMRYFRMPSDWDHAVRTEKYEPSAAEE